VIHLDTSFLIRALQPGSPQERRLLEWLRKGEPVGLSAIAWAEFLCGPVDDAVLGLARTLLGVPAPLDDRVAERAAVLFNASGRRRGTFVDCLVAATAIAEDAYLATENPRDFRPFVAGGLHLAD